MNPSANDFLRAFLESYEEKRRGISVSPERWKQLFISKRGEWDTFMLARGGPLFEEAGTPVLFDVAGKLKLRYWAGEPLKLDGAFYDGLDRGCPTFPFPIVVGIEHENNHTTFRHEIQKLLSVTCPLKVGITYPWPPQSIVSQRQDKERIFEQIEHFVTESLTQISAVVREDPSSEYLFLIGVETSPFVLTWFNLSFAAGEGIQSRHFA